MAALILLVLLLLASAVFSGSEVALFSLSATDRDLLARQGDSASRRVLRLLERPRSLLITILILNTLVNVAAAILAALVTHGVAQYYGWPPALTVFLEVIALTFVLLVVSEITPKLIAARHAQTFSRRISGPLFVLYHLLAPLSGALSRAMRRVQDRLKPTVRPLSGEDLKTMAEIGEAHGTLEEDEKALIHSIIEFGETTVREIMVSRLDIVALPVTATLSEALETIRTSGHSRLPLYVEHLDNIIGIVYAKDLLPYTNAHNGSRRVDWTRLARSPMFVPLGKKLDDLLKDFQLRKTHIAIVVDEYGGTAGLVTLEDVLEEIVGDIRDEHDDDEEELCEPIDAHTYRCDARINLDDLNELLGLRLDTENFDFETLGGLIFHLLGAIPSEGTEVTYENLHLRVETIENHRIGTVLVRVEPPVENEEEISEKGTSDTS
ncbi:hemolysin family protein [Rhodocaloribacter litoris]|uniref:hemolysin family protein n=1 Tax=Rhodocaloribacter litoris TaxID=2558931 RepID=UPI001E474242|nr:hemolysin family protein [Rhodocaloribacter litoris]